MRYIAASFLAACAGAAFTVWILGHPVADQAVGQTVTKPRGPALSSSKAADSPLPAGPVPEHLFNGDGLSAEETVNVAVYENVNRSVVNITTKGSRPDAFFLLEIPSEGTGSGSVVDKTGHILTNYHVVEDAREVEVTIFDGNSYPATFIGADPINDVAIIKIDAPKESLYPVTFGDSGKLRVGMKVFAIGNPFGLERTLTTGIISSLNRSLQIRGNRNIRSIIQIDAAINPGNSGGPLLNSRGRVIGMNTAIASKTGQSSGVGFAIPVNLMARVVPELIQHGHVIRPEIGIQRVYETETGLLIAKLVPDGPAERAGLRGPQVVRQRRGPFVIERTDRTAADTIVAVDGKETKTADEFLGYIESKKPGDSVVVTVLREGKKVEARVTLAGDVAPGNRKPPDTKL
jgi:S1-C subfamily serine protease